MGCAERCDDRRYDCRRNGPATEISDKLMGTKGTGWPVILATIGKRNKDTAMNSQLMIYEMVDHVQRERDRVGARRNGLIRRLDAPGKSAKVVILAAIGEALVRVGRALHGESGSRPVPVSSQLGLYATSLHSLNGLMGDLIEMTHRNDWIVKRDARKRLNVGLDQFWRVFSRYDACDGPTIARRNHHGDYA